MRLIRTSRSDRSQGDPDQELIDRIADGDQRAFSELMDRHLGTIVGLATHMLGDRFAAEDIAQTVFMKTWQTLPNWQSGQAKLITWMRKVATNQCLDRLRAARLVYSDNLPDNPDMSPDQSDLMIAQDRANAVHSALATLPDRQRAALSLSYFQHVSQKDGASILNVSESAYESLLVRARKSLKQSLDLTGNEQLNAGVKS